MGFIIVLSWKGYFAQLGCDCELLPEIRETSLYCFVGTSSRDNVRRPPARCVNTSVREFGDHDGSSPATSVVASPPSAFTTQMEKSRPCDVNAIHFPSGDQSGSVGLLTPGVRMIWTAPPVDG